MRSDWFLKLTLSAVISALFLPNFFIQAQDETGSAAVNLDPVQERQQLEEELRKLDEQLKIMDRDITKTEKEKKTLQNQISLLKQKVSKLNIQIQQSNAMIKDLKLQIADTESSVQQTSFKIGSSQEKLANILRSIYAEDQKSTTEILLSEKKLSDFFDNLVYLGNLSSRSKDLLKDIKNLKSYLETQKQSLDGEKTDLEKVVKMQLLQKQQSESTKKDQESLLKLTDAQYQKMLKDQEVVQKRAAEIRTRLFELIGIPQAPTFGQAYEFAKEVARVTSIRPAFLLAILTQESNIGKNVGQCYLSNTTTGSGVTVSGDKPIAKVMKPSRDVSPFLQVVLELGRDPYNTPVSCPIPSVGGYGGAMGPAQFIPSTWISYKERVKAITGKTADPWDIKDSFLAAGLYLVDYGAGKKTAVAERKAALIYFSGSSSERYGFYGDSVMNIAKQYEADIKELEAL
ncbi:MAG: lytic murein transglycosylase [Candidatus Wildermuthbacteria bacterium]|nr:lytic murein transglycosylase [Candidatus Wildermuthbacteria bacterium]